MNLYLLRHGEAESHANSDAERKLTAAGREEVASVARQFASSGLKVDQCFVSPFVRAQETATEFLALNTDAPVPVTQDFLTPDKRAAQAIEFLTSVKEENILLVSHNPIMSELLSLLTAGNIDNLIILETGNLACISIDIIGLGMGTCPVILTPEPAEILTH